MGPSSLPASFDQDDAHVVDAPNGGRGRREMVDHTDRFARRLWQVTDGVWCMVGNGLSNQTFVEGPDGLIAIDTGESVEEMRAALTAVREHTTAPVVAVIYTHFHYVNGTRAVLDEAGSTPAIWSHAGVPGNLARQAGEVGPVSRAGLLHQFGITLPDEGPDALIGCGIGRHFRNPEHAPFTTGYVAPTDTFSEPTVTTLAGLRVEMTPAPSDADDSITIWFPDLGVCVNNLVWPALFNVFPIRGEEYRDPRVLLDGFDHIIDLGADHLVGTHGPPLDGVDHVRHQVIRSRDAVQFMWDQTVRGINLGLTSGDLTRFVQLPEFFADSYLQSQHYGLAEHHVRQIHSGLRGWFDGDEATLFPLAPGDHADRVIAGFGGSAAVREQADRALADDDLRWALQLATWLVRGASAEQADRDRLAEVLRRVGHRTTAANIRNWCLTRARHLDSTLDTDRFHTHRLARAQVATAAAGEALHLLRVMLDPQRCGNADRHVCLDLGDDVAGLHVRHGVGVPTDGSGADLVMSITREAWADVMAAKRRLDDVLGTSEADTDGHDAEIIEYFSWFDHPSLTDRPGEAA